MLSWERYYSLTGLAPAHYAAIALHPEMKLEYFHAEWADKAEWVEIAKSETTALWNRKYKNTTARSELEGISPSDLEENVR